MTTDAYIAFEMALADSKELLDFYKKAQADGLPPERIEVLKRASLILGVTAWETYVEDFLKEKFPTVLNSAKGPNDLAAAFGHVAKRWLKRPAPIDAESLRSWTGEGWREYIRTSFDEAINALNTPNSTNTRRLFETFLNVDLANVWKWPGCNFASACERLDEIVSKRGTFTHTARRRSGSQPARHPLKRSKVMSFLDFLQQIASTTDGRV